VLPEQLPEDTVLSWILQWFMLLLLLDYSRDLDIGLEMFF